MKGTFTNYVQLNKLLNKFLFLPPLTPLLPLLPLLPLIPPLLPSSRLSSSRFLFLPPPALLPSPSSPSPSSPPSVVLPTPLFTLPSSLHFLLLSPLSMLPSNTARMSCWTGVGQTSLQTKKSINLPR